MKKVILPLAIAAIFSACSTDKKDEKREMVILNDSSMLFNNNVMSDTGTSIIAEPTFSEPVVAAKPTTRKSIAKTSSRNSRSNNTPVRSTVPQNTTPLPDNTSSNPTAGTKADNGTVGTVDNTTTTVPEKKEGWSNAAKGATIGGVTGAVAGAILAKKKGKGAIIGGVIGAAGGYILGRKKDKAATTTGN